MPFGSESALECLSQRLVGTAHTGVGAVESFEGSLHENKHPLHSRGFQKTFPYTRNFFARPSLRSTLSLNYVNR
jgi:hypothetical protein